MQAHSVLLSGCLSELQVLFDHFRLATIPTHTPEGMHACCKDSLVTVTLSTLHAHADVLVTGPVVHRVFPCEKEGNGTVYVQVWR